MVDQCILTAQKAVEVCDKLIQLYPDPVDEINKTGVEQKARAQKVVDYYSKPPAKQPAGGGKGNGTPSPKK